MISSTMMYLTAAGLAICDYIVGERACILLTSPPALRRLGREGRLHRHLQSLMKQL